MGRRTITVLQLGAGVWMKHSIRLLKQAGLSVFAVDRNPDAPAFAVADGYAVIDILDSHGIADYAQQIGADLILVVNGAGVLSGAEASKRLGLPGLTQEVALQSADKGFSRDCCRVAGLSQPEYRVVDSPEKIAEAAEAVGYPVVLKPTLFWGSRGVSFVADPSQMDWAIQFARKNCLCGRYIIEQAIPGTEVSIEGLVQNRQPQILAIGDKQSQDHPNYRIGSALNYPASFDQKKLEAIEDMASCAVQALGIDNGAFDCECMINDDGIFLLEVNPRPGGGHIFGMIVEAVTGVCMPLALVQILLGESVDIRPRYQRGVCYKFFSPPHGIFHEVLGIEEARQLPGILDLGFTMEKGTLVTDLEDEASRPGFVVASGKDREEAIANADRAVAVVQYVMTPT